MFSNISFFRYTHKNVLKINYVKKLHFSLQLAFCYHNVRWVLVMNGAYYK